MVWWLLEDLHEVKPAVQLRLQALVRQAAGMAAGTHWQGSCRAGLPQDPLSGRAWRGLNRQKTELGF